jgi:hypothetical protein
VNSVVICAIYVFFAYTDFQYEAKKRVSAADAMKHPYFRSLGPGVHKLPDGKKQYM